MENKEDIIDKEIQKTFDELYTLYNQGKYEKLAEISNNKNETEIRRLAANQLLQLGPDPRRIAYKIFNDLPQITIKANTLEEGIERVFEIIEYENVLWRINEKNKLSVSKIITE